MSPGFVQNVYAEAPLLWDRSSEWIATCFAAVVHRLMLWGSMSAHSIVEVGYLDRVVQSRVVTFKLRLILGCCPCHTVCALALRECCTFAVAFAEVGPLDWL